MTGPASAFGVQPLQLNLVPFAANENGAAFRAQGVCKLIVLQVAGIEVKQAFFLGPFQGFDNLFRRGRGGIGQEVLGRETGEMPGDIRSQAGDELDERVDLPWIVVVAGNSRVVISSQTPACRRRRKVDRTGSRCPPQRFW